MIWHITFPSGSLTCNILPTFRTLTEVSIIINTSDVHFRSEDGFCARTKRNNMTYIRKLTHAHFFRRWSDHIFWYKPFWTDQGEIAYWIRCMLYFTHNIVINSMCWISHWLKSVNWLQQRKSNHNRNANLIIYHITYFIKENYLQTFNTHMLPAAIAEWFG